MSQQTYSGVIAELGGPELGKTGNEKPRKVVIKQDPSEQYGKTFRVWSSDYAWEQLNQAGIGSNVTVEFIIEEPTYTLPNGQKPKPTNKITDVVEGGGNGLGEVAAPSPETHDWTAPQPTPEPTPVQKYGGKKDDVDWEARTLEIEAAWSIGVLLNRAGSEQVSEQKLVQDAIRLVLLKRQVASELGK